MPGSAGIYRQADLRLHGLDPQKDYVITDVDTNKVTRLKGRELMDQGLAIEIARKPGSSLLAYRIEK